MNTARGCIKGMLNISDKMYYKEIKKELTEMLMDKNIKSLLKVSGNTEG